MVRRWSDGGFEEKRVATTIETEVLVVGGGPVGLTAAMDLAQRGVDVVVAEVRAAGEPPSAKCNHVSARSMEAFRRLGIVKQVRAAGLPDDFPNDSQWGITVTGPELTRVRIPCRRDRYTAKDGPDTWWPTPEPPHRVNQILLEPVLFDCARATAGVTIHNRTLIEGFVQDDRGVRATARDLDSEATFTIACDYLIGCDGARSTMRKAIGATFHGAPALSRMISTYVRAPALMSLIDREPAWMNHAVNPRRGGNAIAVDGREHWLVRCYVRPDDPDFGQIDLDEAIRTVLGVEPEFRYEVLRRENHTARRLVADRFRDGRAFICSDAAHIWAPTAGYGMNAGIADALDLTWMLAAVLRGWAPASLLDAYEAERLPVTDQVSRFVAEFGVKTAAQRERAPAEIEAPGPAGDRVREEIGRLIYERNVAQFCCAGLNFGYFYDDSPIIAYDDGSPPPFSMDEYTPSTVPGCRAPHLWLDDGRSLYDAAGPDHALLRPRGAQGERIERAARARGLPLTTVVLESREADDLYGGQLVLVRPDQHVAWRGEAEPDDPDALIDAVRGAGIR